jgi:hypothetical protein
MKRVHKGDRMWFDVVATGALIAASMAVAGGLWVALSRRVSASAAEAVTPVVLATEPSRAWTTAGADDDLPFDDPVLDATSRSALAACVFAAPPVDHLAWTAMVVDPSLHDTPSHFRLVGLYETELAAIEAATQLADALNECLIPGEAPLTAAALGIESSVGPMEDADRAYSGTPLAR